MQPKVTKRHGLKKHILLPGALLIYTAVMAVYTYPQHRADGRMREFFAILGAEIVVVVLLFFVLRRQYRLRRQREEEGEV